MKNKEKYLNIVSFDVPYPADYGGVIDIFYKIKSLSELGIKIVLHCFQYGRNETKELEKYCSKIYYYKRNKYVNPFIGEIPYIIKTRNNIDLLEKLNLNQYPILFEGLHSTYYLNNNTLGNRFKMVRIHNIEHDYYKQLEIIETNFFKKYFFRNEADLLKKYEKKLKKANLLLAISKQDFNYYKKRNFNVELISAFHNSNLINSKTGKGKFILYHGNLSVGENNFSALYLVNKIFSQINIPVIIAGKNPSKELIKECEKYNHIKLEADWTNEQINEAIIDAHINVLYTFQSTGIKLKLLNSLFSGRFCIVNSPMVLKTGLESLCHITDIDQLCIKTIKDLWKQDFTLNNIAERKEILTKNGFDNKTNALKITEIIDNI